MKCLLGWCATRALPARPEAPKDSTPGSNVEFQALQSGQYLQAMCSSMYMSTDVIAARVIQEELCQDIKKKGTLSDWFSRDENAPPRKPLRKTPNPRNLANAAKAEELERELERYAHNAVVELCNGLTDKS